jgi:hypothetical protein
VLANGRDPRLNAKPPKDEGGMDDLNAYVMLAGVLLMAGLLIWAMLADLWSRWGRRNRKSRRRSTRFIL